MTWYHTVPPGNACSLRERIFSQGTKVHPNLCHTIPPRNAFLQGRHTKLQLPYKTSSSQAACNLGSCSSPNNSSISLHAISPLQIKLPPVSASLPPFFVDFLFTHQLDIYQYKCFLSPSHSTSFPFHKYASRQVQR